MSKHLPLICLAVALCASTGLGQRQSKPLTVALQDPAGNKIGTVTFRETITHRLDIEISVVGLSAGDHAVHIHENPVCDGMLDFKDAGSHFNSSGKQHGLMNPKGHHAGDLPQNLTVEWESVRPGNWRFYGHTNFTVDYLSLHAGAANSVLGRSIIIHDRPDDGKTDPAGNAGNRIACAVINMPSQQ